jgi:hypothetical protein
MNKYKYRKIVEDLVKRSFPELIKRRIIVIETKGKRYTAYALRCPFFDILGFHPKVRGYSNLFLKGIIAHELSHLNIFKSMSILQYYIIRDFKLLSKKYVMNSEISADKIAIEKGYAKGLYLQRMQRLRFNDKNAQRLRKFYWSPKQIKQYAKKIGKWHPYSE